MKQRVLILYTGNSARSQMAEGLLRQDAGDRFEVFSAGVEQGATGDEAAKLDVFRRVRDQIRQRLRTWVTADLD